MTPISITFTPLTDSAILIAARERGFARAEGIDLQLVRTTSWATARDRMIFGQVQAAHMLAPLAIAVTLGLSQATTAIAVPFKLNENGNALTLSVQLAAALDPSAVNRIVDPFATAQDFAAAIGLHHRKPILGVVHRFSIHSLLLRYLLASGGIHPDRDVTLRVLPPSLMVEALKAGEIDGFYVGEPWGSVAVDQGLGEIVAAGASLWNHGVDKVLAVRRDWAVKNPDTIDRLIRALDRAAAWCDDPANRNDLAGLLARPEHLDVPATLIAQGLAGSLPLRRGERPIDIPDFLRLHRDATNFPARRQAWWIYSQFVRWGMVLPSLAAEQAAVDTFCGDMHRRALPFAETDMAKIERGQPDKFFDGGTFDPAALD